MSIEVVHPAVRRAIHPFLGWLMKNSAETFQLDQLYFPELEYRQLSPITRS